MKGFFGFLIVLALASPAMAASKLSIKGHYDITGLTGDGVNSQNHCVDSSPDDKRSYVHQRFRVQPQFKPADGISATLRFDIAEGIWGQDQDFTSARAGDTTTNNDNSEIQVDRAFVDVNTDWVRVRVGLQFIPAGQTQVYRDNQPGLQFNIKTGTPVGIRLGWVKVSESIGVQTGPPPWGVTDEGSENEDTDRYLVDLSYHTDPLKLNLFYVMQKDDGTGDSDGDGSVDNFKDEPYVAGLRARGRVGAVALHGEITTFGGDNGNGTDYVGTQANINGQMKFGDALTLGVDAFYSSGADAGDQKRIHIGNPFARYNVKFGGSMGWDLLTYGRNPAQLYMSSPPGGPLPGDIFDPFLTGAGSIGAGLGAKYIPVDKLTLIGQFHYMNADKNNRGIVGEFDKGYNLLLAAVCQLAPKTSLHATYQLVDAEFMDGVNPANAYIAGLRLRIAF